MIEQLPILIVMVPFLAALVVAIMGWFSPKYSWILTVIALLISSVASLETLQRVIADGPVLYALADWMPPFGIAYAIDHLNGMVLSIISVVALLVAIFSKESIKKELSDRIPHFYTLFLFSTVGLLGMTITGDAFNLYVLLEVSSLTIYALMAMGKGRTSFATFNYIMLGTIGACFYLLGVGYLYIKTGSLNMADIHHILPSMTTSLAVFIAFVLIVSGLLIKSAFFPMHGWLPNAYTYAPTATSAFAAPLMTKVSIYILIRMMFGVFGAEYSLGVFAGKFDMVWLAVIAIVAGSLFALMQTDVKKMLTYIIVAEVGYMVGGIWLGTANGLVGSVYHILSDAAMTLCLFLAVGAVVYRTGSSKLTAFKGAFKTMPLTMVGFLVGAASMIGIPPTCGFFSKWFLISGGIEAGHWAFVVALLFSSLVNAFLFFRIIEMAYFSESKASRNDAPFSMIIPLLVSAVAVVVIGLYANDIVSQVVHHVVPGAWLGAL